MAKAEVNQGSLGPHPVEPSDPDILQELFLLYLTVLGKNEDPMSSFLQPFDKRHDKRGLSKIIPASRKRGGEKTDVQRYP